MSADLTTARGPRYVDIPRVGSLSLADFKTIFLALEQPAIIERFANVRDWEVFRWSLDALAERFGDLIVHPRVNFPPPDHWWINLFELPAEAFPPFEEMTFRDLIRRVSDPSGFTRPTYWRTIGRERAVLGSLQPFLQSFCFNDINPLGNGAANDTNILIGSAGTRASFHQDDRHNFLVHVVGRKRIFLGSPDFTSCFYPFPGIPEKSPVAPDHYLERFPRMKDATILVGEIDPGDVLFIPRGWWHTLIALTPTVMLNHWHGDPLTAAQVAHMYRGMGARYHIAVKTELVQRFVRSSFNILRGRSPIHHMSVWYTPGSAAAVRWCNRAISLRRRVKLALSKSRATADSSDEIPNPFFQ